MFDNFCFLNQVYGLRRDKVSLGCYKKNLVIFGPFLVQNLATFAQKSGFYLFFENCLSEFHVTWSETRDNYFQSFNGTVVSGKILFWPFYPFLVKNTLLVVTN